MNPYRSYGRGGPPRSVSVEMARRLKSERDAYVVETRRLQQERDAYAGEIKRLREEIEQLKASRRAEIREQDERARRQAFESGKAIEERAAAVEKLGEVLAELDKAREETAKLRAERAEQEAEAEAALDGLSEIEGRSRLAKGIGRVRDSAVRALRAIDADEENPWRQGIVGIVDQIDEFLEGEGTEVIGARGEAFDPTAHRAVGIAVASEQFEPGTVVRVEQCGLRLDDGTLVRPASVIVAK